MVQMLGSFKPAHKNFSFEKYRGFFDQYKKLLGQKFLISGRPGNCARRISHYFTLFVERINLCKPCIIYMLSCTWFRKEIFTGDLKIHRNTAVLQSLFNKVDK